MFANGTEYMAFMERQCWSCKKYVDYNEATKKRPVCPIEEKITECQWLDYEEQKEQWPRELSSHGAIHRFDCSEFEAKL